MSPIVTPIPIKNNAATIIHTHITNSNERFLQLAGTPPSPSISAAKVIGIFHHNPPNSGPRCLSYFSLSNAEASNPCGEASSFIIIIIRFLEEINRHK